MSPAPPLTSRPPPTTSWSVTGTPTTACSARPRGCLKLIRAGAVGLCNHAAGLFVGSHLRHVDRPLYASRPRHGRRSRSFACAARAANTHDAGWHRASPTPHASHRTPPRGRDRGRCARARLFQHLLRASHPVPTGVRCPRSSPRRGRLVRMRPFNMFRTARYHHNGEHIVDVPVRFNLKMSEIQAVAAVPSCSHPPRPGAHPSALAPRLMLQTRRSGPSRPFRVMTGLGRGALLSAPRRRLPIRFTPPGPRAVRGTGGPGCARSAVPQPRSGGVDDAAPTPRGMSSQVVDRYRGPHKVVTHRHPQNVGPMANTLDAVDRAGGHRAGPRRRHFHA